MATLKVAGRSSRHMTYRHVKLITFACCTTLVVCPQLACASSVPERQVTIASDFDLSSHDETQNDGQQYRVRQDETRRFRKGDLGPYLTYNPVSGGPTLEFGALGAGRKGTPGLAHVGVDWSF